jgi:RecA/RadA recombinase
MYGPESSGKTTVALHVIAEAQKLGACLELGTWTLDVGLVAGFGCLCRSSI